MADNDHVVTDPPATQPSPSNLAIAAVPPTTDDVAKDGVPAISEVVESVESNVEQEETQGDAPAESDAEGEDEDEQPADSSGRPVSNELYKGLKAIAETLTEFKIKKGGEQVPSIAVGGQHI